MKKFLVVLFSLLVSVSLWAEPGVDGVVSAGEYTSSKTLASGNVTVYWAPDSKGGLYFAVKAKTSGWVGLGLGSHRMNGAYIYMGYLSGDKAVFEEQQGKGHHHSDSGKVTADKKAVTSTGGVTIIEFHVPAEALPVQGKTIDFIVAYSEAANLTSFHSAYDTGSFTLP